MLLDGRVLGCYQSLCSITRDLKTSRYLNDKYKKARLLAIYDTEGYSKKLVRYFKIIGFKIVKEVASSPTDLFLRLVWGGAGTLMKGDCSQILNKIAKKLSSIDNSHPA